MSLYHVLLFRQNYKRYLCIVFGTTKFLCWLISTILTQSGFRTLLPIIPAIHFHVKYWYSSFRISHGIIMRRFCEFPRVFGWSLFIVLYSKYGHRRKTIKFPRTANKCCPGTTRAWFRRVPQCCHFLLLGSYINEVFKDLV